MSRPDTKDLENAVLGKQQWAVDLLSGWVRCPSTLSNEAPAQAYIEEKLREMGLAVTREAVKDTVISRLPGYSPALVPYEGRDNLVARHVPSEHRGRSLIVNGHVDVVSPEPAALWSSPPFEPRVFTDETGETWMQGRGAGDMKGGTVATLWAFEALKEMGLEPAAPITFQSCIEEECTGNGALALCANGHRADACLIPEPFDQTVLVEQAGVLWFEVHILGKTTHVLGAGQGINAIDKAWRVYRHLREKLEGPLNRVEALPETYRAIPHPANLNLGVVEGGDWPSTVAGSCTMRFRMGILPGRSCAWMRRQVLDVVAGACKGDPWLEANPPEVVFRGFQAESCAFDPDSEFGRALEESHEKVEGSKPDHLHATCTTDIRFYNLYYHIPATCYGPKAVAIHGADERVSIDSMGRVATVVAELMASWCLLNERRGTEP